MAIHLSDLKIRSRREIVAIAIDPDRMVASSLSTSPLSSPFLARLSFFSYCSYSLTCME